LAVLKIENAHLARGGTLGQDHVVGRVGADRVFSLSKPKQAGDCKPSVLGLQRRLSMLPPLFDLGLIRRFTPWHEEEQKGQDK
jgi:hypothetical protein